MLRIKTSSALRAVDRWKTSLSDRYNSVRHSISMLLLVVGQSAPGLVLFSLLSFFILLNFAGSAFVFFVLLGIMKLRLHSYRFANMFLTLLGRLL